MWSYAACYKALLQTNINGGGGGQHEQQASPEDIDEEEEDSSAMGDSSAPSSSGRRSSTGASKKSHSASGSGKRAQSLLVPIASLKLPTESPLLESASLRAFSQVQYVCMCFGGLGLCTVSSTVFWVHMHFHVACSCSRGVNVIFYLLHPSLSRLMLTEFMLFEQVHFKDGAHTVCNVTASNVDIYGQYFSVTYNYAITCVYDISALASAPVVSVAAGSHMSVSSTAVKPQTIAITVVYPCITPVLTKVLDPSAIEYKLGASAFHNNNQFMYQLVLRRKTVRVAGDKQYFEPLSPLVYLIALNCSNR